ncbi:hypothetical protein P4S73_19235 [Paraglaciecola sp. Hal342]
MYLFDENRAQPISALGKQVIYDTLQSGDFLWVAARNNLYQVDAHTHEVIQHFDETNSPIGASYNYSLAMKDDTLWIGSTVGLVSFDTNNRTWQVWEPNMPWVEKIFIH